MVLGADREFLESFEEPGSGVILRFVGLYRLRVIGGLLTTTENRLVDSVEWRMAERGQAEVAWGGEKTRVTRAEIVGGNANDAEGRRLKLLSNLITPARTLINVLG